MGEETQLENQAGLAVAQPTPEELLEGAGKKKERLGPWYATAICGNDNTSSCLYVSAIAIVYAHALAPLGLLLAAGVLYLYRKIYTEVVEALPLDGGAYNCLLNCTRKFDASFVACLTLLYGVGLSLAGVPLAILIACLAGPANMVPFLGLAVGV